MFNHASGQLLPEHTWNPRCAQNFSWTHVREDRQLLREHTRNPRHLDLHPHTRHREMFMRQDCCARTPQAHVDLSRCANRHVPVKRLLRSHATSTVGALSVRKTTCSCDRWLRSHATSTLGSLSVRKETCSGKTTVAFSRHEHTWISLPAQGDMFHRKDCCAHTLPHKVDDVYLRTPDPISTVKRAHVPYKIGNP